MRVVLWHLLPPLILLRLSLTSKHDIIRNISYKPNIYIEDRYVLDISLFLRKIIKTCHTPPYICYFLETGLLLQGSIFCTGSLVFFLIILPDNLFEIFLLGNFLS